MAEDVAGAFNTSVTFTVLVIPPPVTVIADVLLPILAVAVFTLAVTIPLPEPDVGLTVNHDALSLAVHVPLEAIAIDWFAGFAVPCVAVNDRPAGVTVNESAETVSVIVVVLVTPPPVTVMVALFVPTAALARFTFAVSVPLPDPEVGLTVSHDALLLAVQLPSDVTETD